MPSANLLAKIDACEQRLLCALERTEPIDWETFGADLAIVRAGCTGEDAPLLAVLDELEILAHMVAPDAVPRRLPPALVHDARFGYGVLATDDREGLLPSFAMLLADCPRDQLADALPGLSIGDYAIWCEIRKKEAPLDVRQLAQMWLKSPARRLAWDVTVLERVGLTDGIPSERLLTAVGGPADPRPSVDSTAWPPVHACTPLSSIAIDESDDVTVVRALRALAAPEWLWSRSQAMGALLDRAVVEPAYHVQDLTCDLIEELPARFGAVFEVPDDEPLIELERELLRVAVSLVPDIHEASRVFGIARWLGYVLVKSPFHANDVHVLAAKLSGIRRDTAVATHDMDEVIHPRRLLAMLSTDVQGWRDFVVSTGAAQHYLANGETRLNPAPITLVERLRRIAERKLTPLELAAEQAAGPRADKSGGFLRHLAPPWVARAILHRARSPWLSNLDLQTLLEALSFIDAEPARFAWLTESIALAGPQLKAAARRAVAEWWTRTGSSRGLRPHHLVLAASAAVRDIDAIGLDRLDLQVAQADPDWRPFLAHTLATSAREAQLPDVERHFLETLERLVDDPALSDVQRQRALAWWIQRLQADRSLLTEPMEARLHALARQPFVTANPRLRLLFSEFGIASRSRAGSTRP